MTVFDPEKATTAYIDGLGPAALQKAADYTAGGNWLLFVNVIIVILLSWIVIRFGMLDWLAARLSKRGWALRTFLISAWYLFVTSIIALPWTIYEGWYREKSYGRTSQPLGDFLAQDSLKTLLSTVLVGLFFLGVYALIRKTGKRWWLWSSGFATIVTIIMVLLAPIFIEPLFNSYKPIPNGPVRSAVVAMAHEANIAEDRLFIFDGSRQSNNFTANVSGVGSSARIAISDVALKSASLDEVKAVTGHEIGHYVLGHVWLSVITIPLIATLLFFLADRLFPVVARLLGSGATLEQAQGLPVIMVILSLLSLLSQPLTNTLSRTYEAAADAYSLRTINLPDGLASALVKTAEYRNPRPHPLQEMLFYTHPSVESRVRNAMNWKAKHPAKPLPAE